MSDEPNDKPAEQKPVEERAAPAITSDAAPTGSSTSSPPSAAAQNATFDAAKVIVVGAPPPPSAAKTIGPAAVIAIGIGVIAAFLAFTRSNTSEFAPGGDDSDDPPDTTASATAPARAPNANADPNELAPIPMLTVTAQPIGARDRSAPALANPLDGGPLPGLAGLPALAAGPRAAKGDGKTPNEEAELDAARAALAKGDNAKALALLDTHDRDFKNGSGFLDVDARALRIEALAKKGNTQGALALADDFLRDYPHSPKATRVQAIADALKGAGGDPAPSGSAPPGAR